MIATGICELLGEDENSTYSMSKKIEPDKNNELPEGFVPSGLDVICGWARQNYHHAGNRRLRDLIAKNVSKYVEARTKTEKGQVIIDIVEMLRRESPTGVGLVRLNPKTGRWSYIGTEKAKDKIGHALRKASKEVQEKQPGGKSVAGGPKRKKQSQTQPASTAASSSSTSLRSLTSNQPHDVTNAPFSAPHNYLAAQHRFGNPTPHYASAMKSSDNQNSPHHGLEHRQAPPPSHETQKPNGTAGHYPSAATSPSAKSWDPQHYPPRQDPFPMTNSPLGYGYLRDHYPLSPPPGRFPPPSQSLGDVFDSHQETPLGSGGEEASSAISSPSEKIFPPSSPIRSTRRGGKPSPPAPYSSPFPLQSFQPQYNPQPFPPQQPETNHPQQPHSQPYYSPYMTAPPQQRRPAETINPSTSELPRFDISPRPPASYQYSYPESYGYYGSHFLGPQQTPAAPAAPERARDPAVDATQRNGH